MITIALEFHKPTATKNHVSSVLLKPKLAEDLASEGHHQEISYKDEGDEACPSVSSLHQSKEADPQNSQMKSMSRTTLRMKKYSF